ncbi:MAG: hypothetical protein ABMA14_14805 [Hyphomonadaceae bacterium]
MTRTNQSIDDVRPVDMEIGGDDDTPGISQELTVDDIDDIAFDTTLSVEDRRGELMNVLAEIRARRTGDLMGDMADIASHLDDRIAALSNPQETETLIESTGMDPDSRSDDDDPADHVDDEDEDLRVQDLAPKQI